MKPAQSGYLIAARLLLSLPQNALSWEGLYPPLKAILDNASGSPEAARELVDLLSAGEENRLLFRRILSDSSAEELADFLYCALSEPEDWLP